MGKWVCKTCNEVLDSKEAAVDHINTTRWHGPIVPSLERDVEEKGRMSRDELYMRAAFLFAEQSTCLRGNVGAVIVKDRRIISSGYNGAPPGMKHCTEVGCLEYSKPRDDFGMDAEAEALIEGCRRTIHAEANALAFAARHEVPTQDATMYCTHAPCLPCSQLIISAGIVEVHWGKPYRASAEALLVDAGLKTVDHGGVNYGLN